MRDDGDPFGVFHPSARFAHADRSLSFDMQYKIPYGKTNLTFSIPDGYKVQVLAPAAIPVISDPEHAAAQALNDLIGSVRWADFAGAKSVAIAINDKTRPVPLAHLLPPLLSRLADVRIPREAITLIVATGTHPVMQPSEFAALLPADILAQYRVISHDCDDRTHLVYRGETSRGTPVWVNSTFTGADLRIAVANLEPHQFQGFSGGVKCASIGLAGRDTVTHNHLMMLDPHSNIARYDDNPARQDVEEIGDYIGVHLALNSIVNENKQVVAVLAGDPRAVMRRGIPQVMELYESRVDAPFELVIASPGGHPKDINLYQAQKALAHATYVTKPGGTVILAAACPEGTGSRHYEEWMVDKISHAQVLDSFRREGYRLGAHKAFQISRDASRERVFFVSDMPPDFARRLLLDPYATMAAALAASLQDLAPDARIGIMPWANSTIPVVRRAP